MSSESCVSVVPWGIGYLVTAAGNEWGIVFHGCSLVTAPTHTRGLSCYKVKGQAGHAIRSRRSLFLPSLLTPSILSSPPLLLPPSSPLDFLPSFPLSLSFFLPFSISLVMLESIPLSFYFLLSSPLLPPLSPLSSLSFPLSFPLPLLLFLPPFSIPFPFPPCQRVNDLISVYDF